MSLQDFLGHTSNITIIDFLAENLGQDYNQTEISKCTGLSRNTIHVKLPELILNKIIEISDEAVKIKKFRLRENEIVNHLIKATFAHSFAISDEEKSEDEQYDQLYQLIEHDMEEPVDVHLPNNMMLDLGYPIANSSIRDLLESESTERKLIIADQ
ncbi:MAG: hypothetical protein C3F06_08700 [Candidatus Methanoperedenaceae archaeon]|nr:MAG: hypothetical protein C3F06_08700 [Candidatus Methanoperedenaceae archaeon]